MGGIGWVDGDGRTRGGVHKETGGGGGTRRDRCGRVWGTSRGIVQVEGDERGRKGRGETLEEVGRKGETKSVKGIVDWKELNSVHN